MSSMKISVLYLGKIECKRLHLVACPEEETMIQSPMVAILIQHPTLGNLLYDTGNTPFYNSVYGEEILKTYPITEFISIEDALAEKGLKPADIDRIILSHLHFDHVGGLQYFVGTKALQNVMVAEEELKNAYYCVMTGNAGAYVKELFDLPGICFTPICEEVRLADDLHLFLQASHTPGVIGMRLMLSQEGCIITTSDTIYTKDSYEQWLPPGGNINKTPAEFFDNLERIQAMQKEYKATLLFGHDYEQVRSLAARGYLE